MLLVATRLAPSPVHGIGLYADTFIAKGTLEIFLGFRSRATARLPRVACRKRTPVVPKILLRQPGHGNYILCSDDACFFNYSDDHNVISTPVEGEQEGVDIAARDIDADEELLYDYHVFGKPPDIRLG
jgi:hypothetical protein